MLFHILFLHFSAQDYLQCPLEHQEMLAHVINTWALAHCMYTHNGGRITNNINAQEMDNRAGEMVKSIAYSSKGPEFNSQQPHGGLQPSIMRFGALFWQAGIYVGRTLHT